MTVGAGVVDGERFGSSYFTGINPQSPLMEDYYCICVVDPVIGNMMALSLVKNNNYYYPQYCKLSIFDKGNTAGDQNTYNTTLRLSDTDTGNTISYANIELDENIYNLFYACYSNSSDLGISGEFTDTV